jgi:stage II sporulation SpoE-like protein
MDLTWALEDIARTSDDAAVRRRFAERNRFWLTILLCFFALVSFIESLANSHSRTIADTLVAVANLAFVAFALFFMRYARRHDDEPSAAITWRAGAWLRSHTSAAALTFVAVQFALLMVYARNEHDWFGWCITMPFLMIGFRMLIAELVLLHIFLLGGGALMLLLGAQVNGDNAVPFFISSLVINLLTCGAELFFSHRMRKNITGEWSQRRASAREQMRMRDELRYAREMQISMLPETAPQLDWLDVCAISVPATEVGGDYYDYFVEEDRIALVCGDVAGHGMASGLVLSALRSGFTLLRDSLHDPAAVLRRLHDLVAQTSRRRMLVTVSVVLVDRARKVATIASAGHPPVILRRADGTVETIELYAPPLGVRLPVDIPQRTIAITSGDTFVLHSDGIYETRSASGEDYGLDRLTEVVRTANTETAEELRNAIIADVTNFRGKAEPADDVTVVVGRLV